MNSEFSHVIIVPLLGLLVCTAITVARMRDLWAAVMLTGIYSFLGASWMLVLDAPDVAFTEAAVGAGISTFLMLGTLALTSRTAKRSERFPWLPLAVVLMTGGTLVYGTLDMPHFGSPDAPIHHYPQPGYVEISLGQRDGTVHDPREVVRRTSQEHPSVDGGASPIGHSPQQVRVHDLNGGFTNTGDSHGEDLHSDDSNGDGQQGHGSEGHEATPNIVTVVLASYRGFDTLGETTVIFTAGIAVMLLLKGPAKGRRES